MKVKKSTSQTSERDHDLIEMVLARYKFATNFTKDKLVIDVGTGLGVGAYYIAQNSAKKVLGVDYSESAIAYAKKHYKKANLSFKVDNIETLTQGKENSFDVVVAFEIIEHLESGTYLEFVKKLKQITRTNGVCLISTPNKLTSSPGIDKPYNPYHTKEFTPEELNKMCKKYFKNTKLYGIQCTNNRYIQQTNELKSTTWYQLISRLGRSKTIREFIAFIPKQMRQKVTGEAKLLKLSENDFLVSTRKINDCIALIAVCKN